MKVSTLKGRIRELNIVVPGEVPGQDEVVVVKYRPGAMSLAALEEFGDTRDAGDMKIIRTILEPLLVSWDLEEDILDADGVPTGETRVLGVTGKDLGVVPMDFLNQVLSEITNDVRPNPQTPAPSKDGSPQTDGSGDLPTGTESSKPLDTFVWRLGS